tara:strand:+ start:192 stop:407 length:216 start_codon:yes stop_codon:yes gene_type:complete
MKKGFTLFETLTVILIIAIISAILIPSAYGVYRIFVRMTTKEKSYYYYNTDRYRRKSDGVLWDREDRNFDR